MGRKRGGRRGKGQEGKKKKKQQQKQKLHKFFFRSLSESRL